MSTNLPGFQSFSSFFLIHFVLAKLAISSIRVNPFIPGDLLEKCQALTVDSLMAFACISTSPRLSNNPDRGEDNSVYK